MGYDIDFDHERAKNWILDVQQELYEVETLLKKVSETCYTQPDEDDTIMNGIKQTGQTMEAFWDNMCNGFKSATKTLENVIGKLFNAGQQVVEDIMGVKDKIGH